MVAGMSVYAAAAADAGKKLKRQSTPTKQTASGRRDWDFTTTGGGGWKPLESSAVAQDIPRPSTSGGGGGGLGSTKLETSPPGRGDIMTDEELRSSGQKESPTGKGKPSKASADLSPYMMSSPYISRAGVTSHSRPVSRNGPTTATSSSRSIAGPLSVYSSPRRSAAVTTTSRPFTPGNTSSSTRPQTVDSGIVRPSTQPAGYTSKAYGTGTTVSPTRPQSQGGSRMSVMSSKSSGCTPASGLQAYLSSRDSSNSRSTTSPASSRPSPDIPAAVPGSQSLNHAAGYSASDRPSTTAEMRQYGGGEARRVEGPTAAKVYHSAVEGGAGPRDSVPSRSGSRKQSRMGDAGVKLATSSYPPAEGQHRPASRQHTEKSPSTRGAIASKHIVNSGSPPGEGHKAIARALSGLGPAPESRPTTQERHAAQREQLGFGRRPTTQERQQLASRAGPRSDRRASHSGLNEEQHAQRPGSRGSAADAIRRSNSSTAADSSRMSGVSGTSLARPRSVQGGRPSSRSVRESFRCQAAERGGAPDVPVIIEDADGEAYGMTLGDYINQMPSPGGERPQSGVSASMAEEDCIPPDNASLLSDCSDYSYVDSDVNGSDYIDDGYSSEYSDSSPPNDESPAIGVWDHIPSGASFTSAVGNGLDLRPATAAPEGLLGSQHSSERDNMGSTREVDLGDLPAALFHPRGEGAAPRPPGSGRSDSVWHRKPGSGRRVSGRSGSLSSRGLGGCGRGGNPLHGGPRKTQSARPISTSTGDETEERDAGEEAEDEAEASDEGDDDDEWGDSAGYARLRPPSRQRPPPEALHLFNALGKSTKGALKPSMSIKAPGDKAPGVRPKTTAGPSRPLSGPQLRLKNDGSGLAHATKAEMSKMSKMTRPPSRQKAELMSAGIRHNAVEDFPDRPPKGQGVYDLDIMGLSDSDLDC